METTTDKVGKEINILLIDDEQADRLAITRSFDKEKVNHNIVEAGNGAEALTQLNHPENADKTFLIILDLNMPVMDGIEFLEAFSSQPAFGRHVVFVLSTSNDMQDIQKSYNYNIAGYFVKDKLEHLVKLLSFYAS